MSRCARELLRTAQSGACRGFSINRSFRASYYSSSVSSGSFLGWQKLLGGMVGHTKGARAGPVFAGGKERAYSTQEHELAAQLMSIPEVKEARDLFEDGRMQLCIQNLNRAVEITVSTRMPQLTVLAAESLAHVYQCIGDFPKEQLERSRCVDLTEGQVGGLDRTGESSLRESYFRTIVQACLADVTMSSFDESKLKEAQEIAEILAKPGDVQLCALIEATGALATGCGGDAELLSDCAASCESTLGPSHLLSAQARLLQAIALLRTGQDAMARDILSKAGKTMGGSCATVEFAGVKVEIMGRLSGLALKAGDMEEAKTAASEALKAAEGSKDSSMIAAGVHCLSLVNIAANDFVVGEGLLRTCLGRLQVPRKSSPTVWDLYLLQDATHTYAGLLEKIVFNNASRKPEGDLAREALAKIEHTFPVTADGTKRLRKGGVGTWYRRYLAPEMPLLLQGTD